MTWQTKQGATPTLLWWWTPYHSTSTEVNGMTWQTKQGATPTLLWWWTLYHHSTSTEVTGMTWQTKQGATPTLLWWWTPYHHSTSTEVTGMTWQTKQGATPTLLLSRPTPYYKATETTDHLCFISPFTYSLSVHCRMQPSIIFCQLLSCGSHRLCYVISTSSTGNVYSSLITENQPTRYKTLLQANGKKIGKKTGGVNINTGTGTSTAVVHDSPSQTELTSHHPHHMYWTCHSLTSQNNMTGSTGHNFSCQGPVTTVI